MSDQHCAYFGADVEPQYRASWVTDWHLGSCRAPATVFINGKGYCEKHSDEPARKHTKPHSKDTRARRMPLKPDTEDKFIDKPVDRW